MFRMLTHKFYRNYTNYSEKEKNILELKKMIYVGIYLNSLFFIVFNWTNGEIIAHGNLS